MKTTLVLSILAFTTSFLFAQSGNVATSGKLESLLYHIDHSYVDEVDEEGLVEAAIIKMLEELDPHSVYIPKEDLQQVNEPLKGNFEGVGIQFNILKDTIFVVTTISGGPSEKLGIRAGDKIVEIDGDNVASTGIKNKDVIDRLRGKRGTKVVVGIARRHENELLDFEITRDKIPIYSIDAAYMASPEIGYIKVNRFSATTMREFREDLSELKEAGMKHLILDLQGNGGGYLNTAIDMVDEFIDDNKLIVYTEGRSQPKDETFAHRPGSFEKGKLVVLIDEGSASASEIVSGAIQDWDRGLILGRRSFGKGLVQRPIMLPDGSAIRLTISRYYTPSGRCIQKPYEDGIEAYHKEKYERYSKGELTDEEAISLPDSLKFYTENKRLVYGGGGILPDIFVPIDTSQSSTYFSKIVRKGTLNTFSLSYVDENRGELLGTYPDVATFKASFEVDNKLDRELIQYAKKDGIEDDEDEFEKANILIDARLKALIARGLWGTSAYYEVYNEIDPVDSSYVKALSMIQDNTFERLQLANN